MPENLEKPLPKAKPARRAFLWSLVLAFGVFFSGSAYAAPDPYKTNPYIAERYDFRMTVDGVDYPVVGYIPSHPDFGLRNRPLVVLLHGAGYQPIHYKEILIFLAKNGFSAVAPEWDLAGYQTTGVPGEEDFRYGIPMRTLRSTIGAFYSVKGDLSNNEVVFIGHSVGGSAVLRGANDLGEIEIHDRIIDIRSVISMAPSPRARDMTRPVSLNQKDIESVLMMMVADDQQVYGQVSGNNGIQKTGFALFDDIGTEYNVTDNIAAKLPSKDILFLKEGRHSVFLGKDPLQANLSMPNMYFVTAYINAYLRRHVYEQREYDDYIVDGIAPESKAERVKYRQAHVPSKRIVAANFEEGGSREAYFYGGEFSKAGRIQVNTSEGFSYRRVETQDNFWSPNKTRALDIKWLDPLIRGRKRLRFNYYIHTRPDVRDARYLSFRAAVLHDEFLNTPEHDQQIEVRLNSIVGSTSKYSDWVRVNLPYPWLVWTKPNGSGPTTEVTKSALIGVNIPLSDFGSDIDLSSIDKIDFSFSGSEQGRIYLDSIQFTGFD